MVVKKPPDHVIFLLPPTEDVFPTQVDECLRQFKEKCRALGKKVGSVKFIAIVSTTVANSIFEFRLDPFSTLASELLKKLGVKKAVRMSRCLISENRKGVARELGIETKQVPQLFDEIVTVYKLVRERKA